MAWLRVESGFPNHRKVRLAGAMLGHGGCGRVLAMWLLGAAYAVDQLTDGFVPTNVFEDRNFDRKPTEVIAAMVSVCLLDKAEGGYQFHHFHHYNPSGAELKTKRDREAARKRLERANKTDVSARTRSGRTPDTARTASGQGAPSEALARAYDHARSEPDLDLEETQGQEQREDAPDFHRVLLKLAHTVLDDVDAGMVPAEEARDEIKQRAARARIEYDGRSVTKALESAEVQRVRVRRA